MKSGVLTAEFFFCRVEGKSPGALKLLIESGVESLLDLQEEDDDFDYDSLPFSFFFFLPFFSLPFPSLFHFNPPPPPPQVSFQN